MPEPKLKPTVRKVYRFMTPTALSLMGILGVVIYYRG